MNKAFVFAFLLILLCGCPGPAPVFTEKAKWVILVYLDSDNNLEFNAINDIDGMESIGSDDNVKIVVQWDRIQGYDSSNGDWSGTKRFLIAKDTQEGIIASQELIDLGEVDMASEQSLVDFLTWGMQNYPAEHYALVLWNHGGGWVPHTSDETSGTEMPVKAIPRALEKSGFGTEKKIDLLVFNQCLMSQIDVAYAVAPYAKVMVASEEIIPAPSMNFSGYLARLAANPQMDEREFAAAIVENYKNFYTNESPDPFTTLSAIDLEKIGSVKSSVHEFALALKSNAEKHWPEIGKSIYFSEAFAYHQGAVSIKSFSTYDLADFAELVRQEIESQELDAAAKNLEQAVSEAVIAEYHGSQHAFANGLTMYFPEDEILYQADYANASDFAVESGWDDFVKTYIALEKTDTIAPSLIITSVSSQTASVHKPLTIEGTATGNNIVSLMRVVGMMQDNKILFLNYHALTQNYRDYEGDRRLPEFFDGENSINYTWAPMAEVLTNGTDFIVAPFSPAGMSDYFFTTLGEYKLAGDPNSFEARLIFDYRTGTLLEAAQIMEIDGKPAPSAFAPSQGDTFSPYIEYYDMQTGETGYAKSNSLEFGSNGIWSDLAILPEGDYAIGLFVRDISGNTAPAFADATVSAQPTPNTYISKEDIVGNWIGKSLSFEIFEDNTCVSSVGLKKTPCTYWFRNNTAPMISFYIEADTLTYVTFLVDASQNKLELTEVLEGAEYVLWREGTDPEEPQEIDAKIIGKWQNSLGALEFKENGNYFWEINKKLIAGTFSTGNGKISMESNGKITQYSYTATENSFSLTDSEGTKIEFSKETTEPETPDPPSTPNPILGSWYNAGVDETVTFNADGTYDSYVSGKFFTRGTYGISGNTLVTNSILGLWAFTFEINANTLYLYDNYYGTTTAYVRK
ncbi:MAG: hypothetical protein JW772_04660 [Candidatus Diapherotrites archaeon]|nr:hypothetical protein [Candidatus Diapherotrites archaeon]